MAQILSRSRQTAAFGLASLVLVVGCAAHGGGPPAIGKPAPPIAATAIAGGEVSLHDYRGHWVVINFFATWCEPCRKEYPALVGFARQERAKARVLGVAFEDPATHALSFHRSEGGTWPIIADPQGRIASRYQVSALPQSFVIDPHGDLAARIFGGVTAAKLAAITTQPPV